MSPQNFTNLVHFLYQTGMATWLSVNINHDA